MIVVKCERKTHPIEWHPLQTKSGPCIQPRHERNLSYRDMVELNARERGQR